MVAGFPSPCPLRRWAGVAALLLLAACAPRPLAGVAPPEAPPPVPAAAAATAPWRYEVEAGEGARELAVEVWTPAGELSDLAVDDGAAPFVERLELESQGRWSPWPLARAASRPEPFEREATDEPVARLPPCPREGCHLRYRFRLAAAARELDDAGTAAAYGATLVAPPSSWLLHPDPPAERQPFRLRVTTPPGLVFASGLARGAGPGDYEALVADLPRAPYSAFGALAIRRLEQPGGVVEVAIAPGACPAAEEVVLGPLRTALAAVSRYYGRPPARRALALLLPGKGEGIGFARALGNGGASILLPIGEHATTASLAGNWEMTHELLHVAFPSLEHRHAWLEEGMATYVEPIVRARAGLIPPEQVWNHLLGRLPFGLPQAGDQGLDRTPTWGRRYWGGALFCFLADVAIRERTQNRRSLDDALRAVLAAGGDMAHRWEVREVVEVADRATGVPVLAELYARMAEAPAPVDLDALWKRLGVAASGSGVVFDETAELAAVRRAIVAP